MRILKNYNEIITYPYSNNHEAIDVVGNNNGVHVLDYITAYDKGKVVDSGTHEELLKKCKEYKKLYESEIKQN